MNFGIVLLVIGVILYIIGNIADAGILYVVATFCFRICSNFQVIRGNWVLVNIFMDVMVQIILIG